MAAHLVFNQFWPSIWKKFKMIWEWRKRNEITPRRTPAGSCKCRDSWLLLRGRSHLGKSQPRPARPGPGQPESGHSGKAFTLGNTLVFLFLWEIWSSTGRWSLNVGINSEHDVLRWCLFFSSGDVKKVEKHNRLGPNRSTSIRRWGLDFQNFNIFCFRKVVSTESGWQKRAKPPLFGVLKLQLRNSG